MHSLQLHIISRWDNSWIRLFFLQSCQHLGKNWTSTIDQASVVKLVTALSQKEPRTLCLRSSRTPRGGSSVLWTLQPSLGESRVPYRWDLLMAPLIQGPDLIFQPSRQRCDMTFIYMILILLYGTFTLGVLAGPPCQSNRTLFIFRARPGPLWNFNFHNWREWDTSNYTIFFGGGM